MQNFDNTSTTLQPVFDIMTQFKNDLLKAGSPLTFIKNNLMDEGMLPVHPDNNCDFDDDDNVIFGSLLTTGGHAAIDIEVCKDDDGTNYTYYVFADKFNAPTIYVNYDNTGKPTDLCFGYDNLNDWLNSVFCNLGQIINKDEYTINTSDYLIEVSIDNDYTNGVARPYAAVYITLKF